MAKIRSAADLTIHVGVYRSFEWFWAEDGSMPGPDVYELLTARDQDDLLASLEHWGTIVPGGRPARSRINEERKNPVIVAIKAGKHRFTAFREESGPTWIVHDHYLKEGEKRDKTGDRAVARTVKASAVYFERAESGTYYERS